MLSATLGAHGTGELRKLRAFFTPLGGDTMMQRMGEATRSFGRALSARGGCGWSSQEEPLYQVRP